MAADVLRELSPARVFARPTADDVWQGPAQESALRQLAEPLPLRVLLGPSGSGRTTLLRHLASQAADAVVVLAIAGAQPTRQTLLAQLLRCIDLPSENLAPAEMQRLLAVFMREQLARGRRVVVQVDDADLMPPAACDELLRLAALARSGTFGAELVFSLVHIDQASSAAADFVRGHDALCVVVLARLKPNEVRWYINWRLQRFGLGGILTDDAVQFIGRSTDGCFAAVDHICQMSLLLLRNRTAERADAALVREAMRLLRRQLQRRQLPARESADAEAELIVSLNGTLLHRMVVGERILLGRSQLNDISLDSAYLSRHHLAIQRRGSGYFLSDLKSINGVYLNGQRVHSAPIGNGDVMSIGPYRLKLIIAGARSESLADDKLNQLADTTQMPAPGFAEPAFLKVIK